jgi:CubicO group peptidase (beta-lactamase class C family)
MMNRHTETNGNQNIASSLQSTSRRQLLQLSTWSGLGLACPILLAGCAHTAAPDYGAARQEAQTAAQEVLRLGSATALGFALVSAERTVWADSYGFADLQTQQLASATTLFGIGSSSKMFATVAVMQLVEQGRLELDAPLVRYLPTFRMLDARYTAITVRMLLNHSSGFAGTIYRSIFTTRPASGYAEQVLAALAQERLKAAPGYMSVYCNDGFTLIELLVREVTGKPYADYVQSAILDPLGMKHSAFTGAPFAPGSYATAYRAGIAQPQEFVGAQASGGLYTNPTDMAAFARIFLNGGALGLTRILSATSLQTMAVDQTLGTFNPAKSMAWSYGLGWDSVHEAGLHAVGVQAWTKGGDTNFYGAEMIVAPNDGLAVVVMGTQGTGFNHSVLAQRVLLRALAEKGRIAAFPAPLAALASPVATVPAGVSEAAEGVYATYASIVQIRKDSDGSLITLRLGPDGFGPGIAPLRYRSDGWFTADSTPLSSYRALRDGSRQYLVQRAAAGVGHYFDQQAYMERVQAPGTPLSAAWGKRVGSSWLLVNESPDSHVDQILGTRRFSLVAIPELPGLVMAWQSGDTPAPIVLDPSGSDTTARMMLVIPAMNGRDLNDLDIVNQGGEEWLRWGDSLHRPQATVPLLSAGARTVVSIGIEGYAEWRALQAGAAPVQLSISGASAWRLYSANFQLLSSGAAGGPAMLPPGTGVAYLILFGAVNTSIAVGLA